MFDQNDCVLAPSGQRRYLAQRLVHPGRVQVGRRFVEDQQRRPGRQDVGDGETLLLAARQAVGASQLEAGQAYLSERLRHPGLHRRARPTSVLQPERHLVLDAVHDQLAVRVLEDEPDPLAEEAGRRRRDIELADAQAALPATRQGVRNQPARARARVLLPDPDGPRTSSTRPGSSRKSRPAERRTRPAVVGPAELFASIEGGLPGAVWALGRRDWGAGIVGAVGESVAVRG